MAYWRLARVDEQVASALAEATCSSLEAAMSVPTTLCQLALYRGANEFLVDNEAIKNNASILKKRHYLLKCGLDANRGNFWISPSKNSMRKKESEFGNDFALIIYTQGGAADDFYVIPYAKFSALCRVPPDRDGSAWNVHVVQHCLYFVSSDLGQVDVSRCHGRNPLPKQVLLRSLASTIGQPDPHLGALLAQLAV